MKGLVKYLNTDKNYSPFSKSQSKSNNLRVFSTSSKLYDCNYMLLIIFY